MGLECSKKLCWPRNVVIVDSFLRSLTSVALGSQLGENSTKYDFPVDEWAYIH